MCIMPYITCHHFPSAWNLYLYLTNLYVFIPNTDDVIVPNFLPIHYRRCLRCSVGHCCNSWCKEEVVLVLQFILQTIVQLLLHLPLIITFAKKINADWSQRYFESMQIGPFSLRWILLQEVARAVEMTNGFLLPIICYLSLPAYRQFCTEPDPDDLKLSTPKG